MPKGIVWQFIVVMHRFIAEQKCVWRSGIILEKDQTRAEVIEKYGLRRIEIRVSGQNKRDLLTVIRHELEKIHDQYPGLKYDELIPCNCDTCRNRQVPYFYRFESLRRRLAAGVDAECDISYQRVNVQSLIDDIKGQRSETAEELGDELKESEIEHMRETLEISKQRLWKLRKRRARKGFETDPDTEMEIEGLESEIRGLEEELKDAMGQRL
jgi:hypothetical protein